MLVVSWSLLQFLSLLIILSRFISKKVWIFMITMQNYFTHLPAPFIGDVYSFWLLYSKGNSKRETGTVEFHSLNLVGFWK